jgi:hypothetical protein
MRTAPVSGDGFAIIARGGYGRGHLASNSDIDITLLHSSLRRAEVDRLLSIFLVHLHDTVSVVCLKALPIASTIHECEHHWQSIDSLVSFTFSRIIVGDLSLHSALRVAWRDYARSTPLQKIIELITSQRLGLQVEEEQPEFLNIKYCAGGTLEVMLVGFLEEMLRIRGRVLPEDAPASSDINICLGDLLRVRELALDTSGTLVLRKTNAGPGHLCGDAWWGLNRSRKAVRKRLLEAISHLRPFE